MAPQNPISAEQTNPMQHLIEVRNITKLFGPPSNVKTEYYNIANGPLAVQAVLKTIRSSEGKHEDECWKDDAEVGAAVFASNDAKEGPRAFSEKRKPEFTGT